MLTNCPLNSFLDRDMLMRHFGHGVGHLQPEAHQLEEIEPEIDGDDTGETEEGVEGIDVDESEPADIDDDNDSCGGEANSESDVSDSASDNSNHCNGGDSDDGGGYATP
jgi:hypothetical protein